MAVERRIDAERPHVAIQLGGSPSSQSSSRRSCSGPEDAFRAASLLGAGAMNGGRNLRYRASRAAPVLLRNESSGNARRRRRTMRHFRGRIPGAFQIPSGLCNASTWRVNDKQVRNRRRSASCTGCGGISALPGEALEAGDDLHSQVHFRGNALARLASTPRRRGRETLRRQHEEPPNRNPPTPQARTWDIARHRATPVMRRRWGHPLLRTPRMPSKLRNTSDTLRAAHQTGRHPDQVAGAIAHDGTACYSRLPRSVARARVARQPPPSMDEIGPG